MKTYAFFSIFMQSCLLLISVTAWSAKKTHCVSKELKLMSCRIHHKSTELNLSKEAVRVFDGTWRGVVKLPEVDKVTGWKSVKVREIEKRKFLEMKVWQKMERAPALELEALHWKVFEVKGTKLELLTNQIIQRRRRSLKEGEKSPTARFVVGKLETHLIMVEEGELMWKVGHTKGKLAKDEEQLEPAETKKMKAKE